VVYVKLGERAGSEEGAMAAVSMAARWRPMVAELPAAAAYRPHLAARRQFLFWFDSHISSKKLEVRGKRVRKIASVSSAFFIFQRNEGSEGVLHQRV
jgi:hypothetical protein